MRYYAFHPITQVEADGDVYVVHHEKAGDGRVWTRVPTTKTIRIRRKAAV